MIAAHRLNLLFIRVVALGIILLALGCGGRQLELPPSDTPGGRAKRDEHLSRVYALQFSSLQGQPQSLRPLVGRPFVLVFWAPWCSLCRDELGSLRRLAGHFSTKTLPIVAVAVQTSAAAVESWLREHGQLPFELLVDSDGEGQRYFGLQSLPVVIVIGTHGEAVLFPDPETGIPMRRIEGAKNWAKYETVKAFAELLQSQRH